MLHAKPVRECLTDHDTARETGCQAPKKPRERKTRQASSVVPGGTSVAMYVPGNALHHKDNTQRPKLCTTNSSPQNNIKRM